MATMNRVPSETSSSQPAQPGLEEVGPVLERAPPRRGQRRSGPRRSRPGPASSEVTSPMTSAVTLPCSPPTWSWLPMIGNWPGPSPGPLAGARVALEDEAEHGHEDQQQREEREERVIGDQRGQAPALVVAELLDHGHRHRQPRAALLEAVKGPERAHEVHCKRVHTRLGMPHTPDARRGQLESAGPGPARWPAACACAPGRRCSRRGRRRCARRGGRAARWAAGWLPGRCRPPGHPAGCRRRPRLARRSTPSRRGSRPSRPAPGGQSRSVSRQSSGNSNRLAAARRSTARARDGARQVAGARRARAGRRARRGGSAARPSCSPST